MGTDEGGNRPGPQPGEALMPGDIGRYRLQRVVATEGASTVHDAVDTKTGQRVAVRRWPVDPALAADRRERMRASALQAAGLQHPGIIELHDFGWDEDGAYAVTAFVEGETLAQYLVRVGRLPAMQGLSLALQLLAALAAAHERGLVHSALNPRHVLVGRNGQLKIAGFGWLAASAGRRPGAFDVPAYMAPEQILGRPADCRADLYSAAVVAYELLTGSWPYQAHAAPRPARALRRDLPAALDAVFERAQARNPEARYRNAAELAAALQAAFGMPVKERAVVPMRHQPVAMAPPAAAKVAAPPGPRRPETRDRRAEPSRRTGVALTAGLAAAVLVVLGGVFVGAGKPVERMHAALALPDDPAAPASAVAAIPAQAAPPSPALSPLATSPSPAPSASAGSPVPPPAAAASEPPKPALARANPTPSHGTAPAPATASPTEASIEAPRPAEARADPKPSRGTAPATARPAEAEIEPPSPAQARANPKPSRGTATAASAEPRPRLRVERPVEPDVRGIVVAQPIEAPPPAAAAEPAPPPPSAPPATVERAAPQRAAGTEPPERSVRATVAMAAPPSPSPLDVCRQAFFMARELCVAYQCASSEYRHHPVCVRMHADAVVRHNLNRRDGP